MCSRSVVATVCHAGTQKYFPKTQLVLTILKQSSDIMSVNTIIGGRSLNKIQTTKSARLRRAVIQPTF